MKIPKRVKVGGITYKVKLINGVDKADEFTVGAWRGKDGVIYIDKNVSKRMQEHFFIHELMHALFFHCDIEQDEHKVSLLATALEMIIKDNPDLFIQ